jgi:amiloride-sensitive sodium channel subunit alpha
MVHNQTKSIQSLEGGIFVAPGTQTYVAVSKTVVSKQPKPYSNCISDMIPFSDYSATIFAYFASINSTSYYQDLCINLCYQDKLISSCSCASITIPTFNNTRYCETTDEMKCSNDFDSNFFSSNPDEFCEDVCRPACESDYFDLSVSFAKYPTQNYINSHRYQNVSMQLRVDFKDSSFTHISESPELTFELLLGDIGGQMHLFIGLSFLTMLELVELFFEVVIISLADLKIKKTFPEK